MTLTDLQEAEKTIGRSRPAKTREEEKEEKEKQDKEKQEEKKETETKDDDYYRSKYRSFEEVRLYPASVPPPDVFNLLRSLTSCSPASPSALQASLFVVLLYFCCLHRLHPVLLQRRLVLQLPEQAQQSDGHHVLLQPLLQRHRKRSAIVNP